MKLLIIAYNEALDDEIVDLLVNAGADTYTRWTKVQGVGKGSGPHLGTHVWPKHNNVLAVCVQNNVAKQLMGDIRGFRKRLRNEGVKAFALPVEDVTM